MKKSRLTLVALLICIMSSYVFASFNDLPYDHWAYDAVKTLYNKGLLAPTLDDVQNYNGDGVFSRYEVAMMVFYTMQNLDEKLWTKASAEDVSALKALVADLAPEIAKAGASVKEIDEKLKKLEKSVEKKVGKKVDKLAKKVDKFKITGDFKATQTLGLKGNSSLAPGTTPLNYKGKLAIVGETAPGISTKIRLGIRQGDSASVDALELKAKSEVLTLTVFKDQTRKVPSFEDTMALFNGAEVGPDNGIILNGKTKKLNTTIDYTGVMFKTKSSGDVYGLQLTQNLDFLSKMKMTSYLREIYVEKVLRYQYTDKDDPNNAKSLVGLQFYNMYRPSNKFLISIEGEYATRKGPGIVERESKQIEYLLPISNDSALFLYGSSSLKLGPLGKLSVAGGAFNSGEDFQIGGLGTYTKSAFAETGVVKLEHDKKGIMGKVGYKFKILDTSFVMSSYGNNTLDEHPEEKIEWKNTLNLIPGKITFTEDITIDRDLKTIEKATQEEKDANELTREEGKMTSESRVIFNLKSGLSQDLRFKYENDKDQDAETSAGAKAITIYADNVMMIGSNMQWKVVGDVYKSGLGLNEDNKGSALTRLQSGYNFEIKDVKYKSLKNKFLVGGRYSFENTGEEGTDDDGNDKNLKDDKSNYRLFGVHEVEIGNLTLLYGAKFEQKKVYIKADEALVDDNDDDNISYAVGMEYSFGNDVTMKIKYGDATITETDNKDKFMDDKTSFADGEQKQVTFEVSAKF